MKISKLVIKFSLMFIVLAILVKFWITYSCSFRIDKIEPNNFFQRSTLENLSDNPEIKNILDQKYKFFSKGRQSFVFISEDNKYVIKFFRFHRYFYPFFVRFLDSLSLSNHHIVKLKKEIDISYKETMASYKIAYEQLSDETATIYIHLNKTKYFDKKIQIVDKFSQSYYLDLDNLGFVIQKKATPFVLELQKIRNNPIAVKNLIGSFFKNLNSIYKKNVFNNDRHLIQNLAVINDKIVEIDIGRFAVDKRLIEAAFLKNEATHYTEYLKKWILKNIPEHIVFFDQELDKLIKTPRGDHD